MDLVIGYQTSPTRYLFRSGASEATEFFTKRVVTNEERSVYKISGAVLDDIEMARAVIHRLRPSSLLAHDVSPFALGRGGVHSPTAAAALLTSTSNVGDVRRSRGRDAGSLGRVLSPPSSSVLSLTAIQQRTTPTTGCERKWV